MNLNKGTFERFDISCSYFRNVRFIRVAERKEGREEGVREKGGGEERRRGGKIF